MKSTLHTFIGLSSICFSSLSCAPPCGQQRFHSPDEDDDGGRLGHGSNHAAHTDDTQKGEEGLLTSWAGTLPWESHSIFAAARDARAASQVLKTQE